MEDKARHGTAVKNFVIHIETYFEEHSTASIVARALYVLVPGVIAALEAADILGPTWTATHTIILLGILLALAMFLDAGHVLLLRKVRREAQKQKLTLTRVIRQATQFQQVEYEYESYEWDYYIESNGDGRCVRRTVIKPLKDMVYCQDILCGSVGGAPGLDFTRGLGLVVVAQPLEPVNVRASRLQVVFLEDYEDHKEGFIILDPPLEPDGCRYLVTAEYRWAGLWKPFVDQRADVGRLRIHHPIQKFRVRIIAPLGFTITHFRPTPKKHGDDVSIKIGIDPNGRSTVDWTARNVAVGDINYKIECEKTEPAP